MKIRYLGTGAAEGVPAMFCNCEYCRNIRKMGKSEWRTRSQVLLDNKISVDFPPEAYYHSLEHGVDLSSLEYLLVTHSHMDHFYAHDFILRGYKYAKVAGGALKIFGNAEVKKVFSECTAREMKSEVSPNLIVTEIKPYELFKIDDYTVITIPANHGKTEDALLFSVKRESEERGYLHLYDTGLITSEAVNFLKEKGVKAGAVSFDCTFAEREGGANARHMGMPDVLKVKAALEEVGVIDEHTKCVITHFSHNGNPTREKIAGLAAENGVIAAYDGFEVEF